MTKQVDFRVARDTAPGKRNVLDEGPPLSSLLKGPAIGGPCDGAKIQAPPLWDGRVWRSGKDFPGWYEWDRAASRWEWQVQ